MRPRSPRPRSCSRTAERFCGRMRQPYVALSAGIIDATTGRYCISMSATTAAYTLTDAARVTGRSRITIRRYLDAERFPNAFRTDEGNGGAVPWMIPDTDLLAAGLEIEPDRILTAPRQPRSDTGMQPLEPRTGDVELPRGVAIAVAEERLRTITILSKELVELRSLLSVALGTSRAASGSGR